MTTVDISTGVQMKQRPSKRHKAEEGGWDEMELVRGYNEAGGSGGVKSLQGQKNNCFKFFGFIFVSERTKMRWVSGVN